MNREDPYLGLRSMGCFAALAALVLLYLVLSSRELLLPGLNFDEAFLASAAIDMVLKKPIAYLFPADIMARHIPLMATEHYAALVSYLLWPFFAIFGISVFSLRVAPLVFGAATLVCTYLLTAKLFDRRTGIITALFLATGPNYILTSRFGNFFLTYALFFSTLGMLVLYGWYTSGRRAYLALGAFLLGLAVSSAVWSSVLVIALASIGILLGKAVFRRPGSRLGPLPLICIACAAFCAGIGLFLWANFFNASTRFITVKTVIERFHGTPFGIDNLQYLKNLGIRCANVFKLVSQRTAIKEVLDYNTGNNFFAALFFASTAFLVFMLLRGRSHFAKKRLFFILSLLAVMLLASPFTLTRLTSTHLIIMVPYIEIICAVGLVEYLEMSKRGVFRSFSRLVVALSILATVGINFFILSDFYWRLCGPQVRADWSTSIYELSDWLKAERPPRVISLTWGFSRNLYFLSRGSTYVHSLISVPQTPEEEQALNDCFASFMKGKESVYLANVLWDDPNTHRLFIALVERKGKQLKEVKRFYHADGKLLYVVYAVR